jgi:hypothetical protein
MTLTIRKIAETAVSSLHEGVLDLSSVVDASSYLSGRKSLLALYSLLRAALPQPVCGKVSMPLEKTQGHTVLILSDEYIWSWAITSIYWRYFHRSWVYPFDYVFACSLKLFDLDVKGVELKLILVIKVMHGHRGVL